LDARVLDDQSLCVTAGIFQRDAIDAAGPQPAARERQPLAIAGANDQVLGVGEGLARREGLEESIEAEQAGAAGAVP
jgi:hypothetical protein